MCVNLIPGHRYYEYSVWVLQLGMTPGQDNTVFHHLPTKLPYFPFPTVNRFSCLGYPYVWVQHRRKGPDKGIFLFRCQNHATLAYLSNSQLHDRNSVTLRFLLPDWPGHFVSLSYLNRNEAYSGDILSKPLDTRVTLIQEQGKP
jgi:hypothetical protein